MAGNTALQAWREVPFTEFSPYETREKLPDGAYLGQIVATKGPDQPMFRVVQNSGTEIEWDNEEGKEFIPRAVQVSYGEESSNNNVIHHVPTVSRDNYRVNSGRTRVPLSVPASVEVDQFQGGYMCVIDGPGNGQIYNIHSNSKPQTKNVVVGGNSVSRTVANIYLEEELRVSFTEDTEVRLVASQYKNVVLTTRHANLCCGFALVPVPANHYFLAQIRGACLVNANGGPGNMNLADANSSGEVRIYKNTSGAVLLANTANATEINRRIFGQELGYVLEPRNFGGNAIVMAMLDIV